MKKNIISSLFLIILSTSGSDAQGIITTIAGNGSRGYSGDGGPALSAALDFPKLIAGDTSGNIYIAGEGNYIRKINILSGIISTIAGCDTFGFSGDGGPATNARINSPQGGCTDRYGNLYFADYLNSRVRKVDASTGIITTIAGNGVLGYTGDGGLADTAAVGYPSGVAVDSTGNIYISQYNCIRMINAATGIISTITGGVYKGYSGDGGPASAATVNQPGAIHIDKHGNIFFADWQNNVIREINYTTGIITTIAGNVNCSRIGYSGDDGPATDADLFYPEEICLDNSGNVFFTDSYNNRVRFVNTSTGIIKTVAGNGYGASVYCCSCSPPQIDPGGGGGFTGDGGAATSAELSFPYGVFIDGAGDLLFSDAQNNRIRRVSNATSIKPLTSALDFIVLPNPSTGIFEVQTNNKQQSVLEIFNIVGEKVYQASVVGLKQSVDISGQPTGVYAVFLRSEGSFRVQKLLICH